MPETTGARVITIRCPTHNIDFEVDSGERITCPQGPHALAQDFPEEAFWEYCCDCQRFRPSEINQGAQSEPQCPVCGRQIIQRYLCGICKVMSVESEDRAVKRKQYTFTDAGAIAPACPGCANIPSVILNRHECEDSAATFTTPRDVCPFCDKPTKIEKKPEPEIELKSAAKPRSAARGKGNRVEAIRPVLVDASTSVHSSSPVPTCPHCGMASKPNEQFCGACGMDLNGSSGSFGYSSSEVVNEWVQSTEDSMPTQPRTGALPIKLILGVVGGIVLLGTVLIIGSLSIGGNAVEKKLDKAIATGNLLGPSRENAHDLYYELRDSGANEQTLKRIAKSSLHF